MTDTRGRALQLACMLYKHHQQIVCRENRGDDFTILSSKKLRTSAKKFTINYLARNCEMDY